MNNIEILTIKGRDTLISELGYWPEFCDAKIMELTFYPYTDDGTQLSLVLRYIDMNLNRDLHVKIILYGILDMNFNEFRTENVIDKLSISDSIIVDIEAAAGLSGFCKCKSVDIEVISSKPYSNS
jgi:hypothetical protein